MRIGGTTIPTSQALVQLAPRPVATESQRRDRGATPDRSPEVASPADGKGPETYPRFATLTPEMSKRGQRAVDAYTQHDVIERRAQYATLLGVDVYV